MKKISDFIVDKRYWILGLFIILSIISIIVSDKVNINYDIAKYLPSTSETRIGMDIMEDEFEETSSSLNLMFKNLKEEKKNKIYDELLDINGVSSVDYDNTDDYNRDNNTLYIVNVDDTKDSKLATDVFNEVTEKYKDYEIYTSGDIADRNTSVLPMWIIVLAVGTALVILIIMCQSYIEPFLFLFTILMAVVLNKGTNVFFNSVSNITDSIAAILQMALSMDYSIMLINRYRQEREKDSNKVNAMKKALHNAFTSISSSSATTIVGLITLVFMSFKIGMDLGLVLAKGVLFSLICIFFVLPSLILMFDKVIEKTKKKSPIFELDLIGKISYKLRYLAIPVFILVFFLSFMEKGNLDILYTQPGNGEISKVFPKNNQIAIIYKNDEEEKISKYLKEIDKIDGMEKSTKVKDVLAYSNTINENLKYEELNDKLSDLGSDVTIDQYLLKIIYYNYYNQEENNKLSFPEFVQFIKDDVYQSKDLSEDIDEETKNDVNRLENFTNSELFNKKRTSDEIAKILEIDKSTIDDILIYYNSKNNDIKISLNDFINFMNNDVLTDEKYSQNIDSDARANLSKLAKFTNKKTIQTKMTSNEIAKLFGIDNDIVKSLYTYYISVNEIDTKLTLSEFSEFVLTDVMNDSKYSSSFDENTINNIKMLNTFSNKEIITKEMNSNELSSLLGVDEETAKQILYLKYSKTDNGTKISIADFIDNITIIKNNTNYLDGVDLSSIEKLSSFAKNQNNMNNTPMNKTMLSTVFDNVNAGLVNLVYTQGGLDDDFEMTPQAFVDFVLNNFSSGMNQDQINSLKLLKKVIDDSLISTKPSYTATELSNILGLDKTQAYNLYALIDLVNGNTNNWKMTPNDFVKLAIQNTTDKNTLTKLKLLENIMTSTLNNTSYSYKELSKFIGVDESTCKNIYTLYVSKDSNLKLSPEQFVNFILNHKNDPTLSSSLDKSSVQSLSLIKSVIDGVLNNKKYSSSELANLLGFNEDDLKLLYGLYASKYNSQNISIREFINFLANDVMKNDEYSGNFDETAKTSINTINGIINSSINNTEYSKDEIYAIISRLNNNVDKKLIDLLYIYYGSEVDYNNDWTLTVEKFVNYLNDNILKDTRFDEFIEGKMRDDIVDAKETITDAKKLLVGDKYSRIILNTTYNSESEETFNFIKLLQNKLDKNIDEFYVIGDSPMAYEMSQTFNDELNFITILTMIAIFIVVALTFKSVLIPLILVLMIQCAVFMIMGILSFTGESVYFIALLIVQSILMGATIDYAILYTSYYLEHRKTMGIKESIIKSYNKSIHTILTSASILILVTLIVGHFTEAITSRICKTISQGTMCSAILILVLLPAVIAMFDRLIIKKK